MTGCLASLPAFIATGNKPAGGAAPAGSSGPQPGGFERLLDAVQAKNANMQPAIPVSTGTASAPAVSTGPASRRHRPMPRRCFCSPPAWARAGRRRPWIRMPMRIPILRQALRTAKRRHRRNGAGRAPGEHPCPTLEPACCGALDRHTGPRRISRSGFAGGGRGRDLSFRSGRNRQRADAARGIVDRTRAGLTRYGCRRSGGDRSCGFWPHHAGDHHRADFGRRPGLLRRWTRERSRNGRRRREPEHRAAGASPRSRAHIRDSGCELGIDIDSRCRLPSRGDAIRELATDILPQPLAPKPQRRQPPCRPSRPHPRQRRARHRHWQRPPAPQPRRRQPPVRPARPYPQQRRPSACLSHRRPLPSPNPRQREPPCRPARPRP